MHGPKLGVQIHVLEIVTTLSFHGKPSMLWIEAPGPPGTPRRAQHGLLQPGTWPGTQIIIETLDSRGSVVQYESYCRRQSAVPLIVPTRARWFRIRRDCQAQTGIVVTATAKSKPKVTIRIVFTGPMQSSSEDCMLERNLGLVLDQDFIDQEEGFPNCQRQQLAASATGTGPGENNAEMTSVNRDPDMLGRAATFSDVLNPAGNCS